MTTDPPAPAHLSTRTTRLWRHVVSEYELEPHHLALLRLACEALDRAEEARQALEADGITIEDRFGQLKQHPAVSIERDSRLSAARLLRELGLDEAPDPDATRPPRIGGRG